jgi:DNA mismatch repair protein MutS
LKIPKQVKGIVKRGVAELITPGVAITEELLDGKRNNFLAALSAQNERFALALLDVSTGDFQVAEGHAEYIESLITHFDVVEVLLPKNQRSHLQERFDLPHPFSLDPWVFEHDFAHELLTEHFETSSLEGFGISPKSQSIGVAGALLHYLNETQHQQKSHIQKLNRLDRDDHLWMDAFTFKSLELFHPLNPGGHALISIIDQTLTPMGARTLRQWIARPLTRIEPLLHRHERVAFFKAHINRYDRKFKNI